MIGFLIRSAFLGACLLSLVTNAFGEVSKDIQQIQKKGKIVIALTSEDSPPYFMKDKNGKYFGLDIELAELIGKEMGVVVELDDSSKTFDDVVEKVSARTSDIAICKLSTSLERAKKVLFTKPYAQVKHAILMNRVKNYKLDFENPKRILAAMNKPGVTLGVTDGSIHEQIAREEFNKAKISVFKTKQEMFKAVSKGDILFAITSETNVNNWVHFQPSEVAYVRHLFRDDSISQVSMATHWDRKDLYLWLNLFIDSMEKNGTMDQLKKKYLDHFDWANK